MAVVEKLPQSQPTAPARVPVSAAAAAALGLAAAWFAAGSAGFVPDGLRNTLTWSLLLLSMFLLWTNRARGHTVKRRWPVGIVLAGVSLGGLIVTAFNEPVASTAAVAAVLATLAAAQTGVGYRPMLLAAGGAFVLAVYRFAVTSIAAVWLAADAVGGGLGRLAGSAVGQPLELGPTFAGLDYLVVMAFVFIVWLVATPRPRRWRAVGVLAAMVVAHFVYLIVLASSDRLASLLPPITEPPQAEISLVGLSTWGNALHALLPWNLPLVALVLHALVAAVLFRRLPTNGATPPNVAAAKPSQIDELFYWGSAVLAVMLPVVSLLSLAPTSLAKKNIVAYEHGRLSWSRPLHGVRDLPGRSYGMLAYLVEMLGGTLTKTADLSADDLSKADVLVLIHPDRAWSEERLQRLENYVRDGGALLIAAEPPVVEGERRSRFDEPLAATAVGVRREKTAPAAAAWEQSLQTLAHSTTALPAGRGNRFGVVDPAALEVHWPAHPLLVGQYGELRTEAAEDSPSAVMRLGDVPLAVEQRLGAGRVIVLGDTAALSNDGLMAGWEFTGRLLSYLADKSAGSSQDLWRQILASLAVAAIVVLALLRPHPLQFGAAAAALAVAWLVCLVVSVHATRVVPDGGIDKKKPNMLAYIDASHSEAYEDALGSPFGIDRFARTLMRNGYLPLLLRGMTAERLEKAELLVSVAPARPFSADELAMTDALLTRGGVFVCTVGAEEVGPNEGLLEHYGMHLAPSPIGPGLADYEPWPLGNFSQTFDSADESKYVVFYAGWPLDLGLEAEPLVVWVPTGRNDERPVVARTMRGKGMAVVVADTYFIANANMAVEENGRISNEDFWPWLLKLIERPAPTAPRAKPVDLDMPIEPDDEGGPR